MRARHIVIYRYYDNPGGPAGKFHSTSTTWTDLKRRCGSCIRKKSANPFTTSPSRRLSAPRRGLRVPGLRRARVLLLLPAPGRLLCPRPRPAASGAPQRLCGQRGPTARAGNLALSLDGKFARHGGTSLEHAAQLVFDRLEDAGFQEDRRGFNPTWSADSTRIFFDKDPGFYARYTKASEHGRIGLRSIRSRSRVMRSTSTTSVRERRSV